MRAHNGSTGFQTVILTSAHRQDAYATLRIRSVIGRQQKDVHVATGENQTLR